MIDPDPIDRSGSPDRLYDLLPAVVRLRDHDVGEPLRALVQVVTSQVRLLEDDLDRLYDDWFVETCAPWVVPYIADLIGHAPIADADPSTSGSEASVARDALLLPRREVAHTLRWRRRKGTLALLDEIAAEVTGWPAVAVEYGRRLVQSPSLRLVDGDCGRTVDLRGGDALRRLGGPFDRLAHTPDLRRTTATTAPGRYAPPSVVVFAWRLRAYPATRTPAARREDIGHHCFTFSVLGNDAPLFVRQRRSPATATRCGSGAEVEAARLDLPEPIDRAMLATTPSGDTRRVTASPDVYGLAKQDDGTVVAQSLAIWAPGWPDAPGAEDEPIPASRVLVADLDRWRYRPPAGFVAVDPVRGRIAFPPRQSPPHAVLVSYHYGFPAELGGGEYRRPVTQVAGAQLIRVAGVDALREALKPWSRGIDAHGRRTAPPPQPEHAVVEITDSDVYTLPIALTIAAGHTLQLRAAQRTRPVIRLLDWQVDQSDSFAIDGGAGSRFTLDGLLVTGRGVRIGGALASCTFRHVTLVPGWTLQPNCDPNQPAEPSIEVVDGSACITIAHSIVGSIQIDNDEVRTDPIVVRMRDSVIDATGANCEGTECEAIGAAGPRLAFATLSIERSTVIGRVMAHAIRLAQDSLFLGRVQVARRQVGCVRFCYVTPGSRTPQRFHCQPDGVEADAVAAGRAAGDATAAIDAARERERARVRPRFDSVRYGTPTYCRLSTFAAPEIAEGAEDESEMGVYHDLYQPQRAANLRTRLDEFTPAGVDAGLSFAN